MLFLVCWRFLLFLLDLHGLFYERLSALNYLGQGLLFFLLGWKLLFFHLVLLKYTTSLSFQQVPAQVFHHWPSFFSFCVLQDILEYSSQLGFHLLELLSISVLRLAYLLYVVFMDALVF